MVDLEQVMNRRFSLYKIEDEKVAPFDATGYSRFKFGDTYYARVFGNLLFDAFIREYADLILKQAEIILFPSPYYSIPTASNFLCKYFKNKLNYFLFTHDKKACIECKIHRKQTYVQDYGNMSYEERVNLIANDTYYIDKHFVDGKFCIFLDDIKITGSHEDTVGRILKEYNVSGEFIFVYFAELINKDIHPRIENFYNFFIVKTVKDIVEITNSEFFQFNTRIVKFILLMNTDDFNYVYECLDSNKRHEILNLAITNNYHKVKEYINNIEILKNKLLWQ